MNGCVNTDEFVPDEFHSAVFPSQVQHVAVHARAAVLTGLSPVHNRRVPPLRPELVARLALDFPQAATTGSGGCNPMHWRLQPLKQSLRPHGTEAAALCNGRLQSHASLAPAAPQLRVTLNGGLEGLRSTLPSYHPSQLRVTLNGGLEGLPALRAAAATPGLDGLMCGRCE